jgi:hypothetical protein
MKGHALSRGHRRGGSIGMGGTNNSKGQCSKGWHDVLWRSSSDSRDAAAVAAMPSWTLFYSL